MNYKQIFFLILFNLAINNLFAEESRLPCFKADGTIGFTVLDNFDCDLIQGIIKDPKIKTEFKKDIQKKLAANLAQKANDALEEIGLLDAYFDRIGLDLSRDSKDVKTQCRLDAIAKPKCGMNEEVKAKISLLRSYFPKSTQRNLHEDTLLSGMIAKSNQVRGGSLGLDANKCPANSPEGFFFIESQLGKNEAAAFISAIKLGDISRLGLHYKRFPQLKMISVIPELKNKFEALMKGYSEGSVSEKDFVENFIKDTNTQKALAKNLAEKCENLSKNIFDFICTEPENLGTTPEERNKLFGKSETDQLNKEIARGFSCSIKDEKTLSRDQSISALNADFTKDLRKITNPEKIVAGAKQFCDIFSCQDPSVTSLTSCKKGGPVRSTDLYETFCKNKTDKCNGDLNRYISYLSLIEKDFDNSKGQTSLASTESSSGSADTKKPSGYSSFYQNFLGVEGTLAVEGKAITPTTIAAKTAEFHEKKLEPTTTISKAESRSQGRNAISEGRDSGDEILAARVPSGQETFIVAGQSDQARREFINSFGVGSQGKSAGNSRTKKMTGESGTSSSSADVKELQSQLASVINSMKGSEGQKLDTIVRSNNAIIGEGPIGSGSKYDRAASEAERERLKRYRESLNAWEGRLQNWSSDLTTREIQGYANSQANSTENQAAIKGVQKGSGDTLGAASGDSQESSGGKGKTAFLTNGKGKKLEEELSNSNNDKFLADDGTFIVNSENLSTLERDTLSKIGIVSQDSFILSVRHQKRIYAIPVQSFKHNGKNIFVPLLNESNRELAKIVLESPLFSEYRKYKTETEVSAL